MNPYRDAVNIASSVPTRTRCVIVVLCLPAIAIFAFMVTGYDGARVAMLDLWHDVSVAWRRAR